MITLLPSLAARVANFDNASPAGLLRKRAAPAAPAAEFDPFAGPEIARLIPLTASQAEIWLACQLGGDDASRAYNESVSLRLRGVTMDASALRAALRTLAGRHEALRATCSANGSLLCVLAEPNTELHCADLSAGSADGRTATLARHTAEQAEHVFNLLTGPLWQASLLRLAEDEFYFTLTAHHLICDGWSLGILLQEVSQLYSAAGRGGVAALAPATPFGDYADQEALFQASKDYRQTAQFWRQQFADGAPVLNLPTDFPRPVVRTYQSRRLDYSLPPALVAGLRRTGVQAGSSFVTTLLALFEVLLFKLTGQEDLVVGLPAAGQSAAGTAALVGHCVNLLPLRSRPTGAQGFADYLQARKTYLFDALEHQQLTYGSLLNQLPLRREPGRLPLVSVLFNVDLGLANGVDFAGLRHELQSNPRAFENFELSLNASGTGDQLVLECSYNVALFRPERIGRLLAGFEVLAEQVVANPVTLLADLHLLTPALPAAYVQLNATQAHYPASATLPALIGAQVQAVPTKTAVKFGALALSYAELDAQASQLAAYLQTRQHLQPGELVGLALDRSPALLVAVLAVLKCGAAYVPLDPAYPPERIEFMLADSGARLLLTAAGVLPHLTTDVPRLILDELAAEAAAFAHYEPAPVPATGESLLYVLYTSGSTGQPKGVAITHRNVVNFLTSMQREPGLTSADRLLAVTTISFDIAGLELFLPLVSGATVVLADAYTARDGRALLELLKTERITLLQATPATWHLLLAAGWEQPLPHLTALCGGEPLPPDLAQRLLSRCRALWNVYGPTETTIWSAVQRVAADAAVITVGRPIANTQIYVLDEQLEPVAPGTRGELFIGGAGVAQGYWRRPALTASRFLPDPFAGQPGAKMYRTGDAGQLLASGELQVLGRLDEQLKLRGYRIEPGEIEARLTRLPAVSQAVVVAQEAPTGDKRLVAYLVLVPESAAQPGGESAPLPTDSAVRRAGWQAALHAQLPAHMVPAEFVVLDALPLTPNGKVNRQALQRWAAAPPASTTGYVAPRTDVEQLVAGIWREALKNQSLGVFDNFFEVGGHSLVAVQVMAQLEKATGQRLPLAALFTYPTVAELALLLGLDGRSVTWDSLVPIKPEGTKMPLYIVHGAGMNVLLFNALARNLDPDQPVYGLQAKGLDGIEEPLARIEDMAAHYIAAIRAQNPDGPYALAGYSFGGIIAFEMAKQLLEMGKEIKLLALFDTHAYQSNYHAPWPRRLAQNAATSLKRLLYLFVLLVQDPAGTYAHKKSWLRRQLAAAQRGLRRQPSDEAETAFGYPPRIDAYNEQAERDYVLRPVPVAIELFRARKRTFYLPDFTYLGWQPLALKGIRIQEMPGEHSYMFAPPYDKGFAAALQAALDQATD